MYTIRFDLVRRIFHLTLSGFRTMGVVVKFGAALLLRSTAIRLRHRHYAVLSDASDFPIQSAQVSTYFERILTRRIEMDVGACAIVVATSLNKLQAERIFASERVRVFVERTEADAWLTAVWR